MPAILEKMEGCVWYRWVIVGAKEEDVTKWLES